MVIPLVDMQSNISGQAEPDAGDWLSMSITSVLAVLDVEPAPLNILILILGAFGVKSCVIFTALWYTGVLRAALLQSIRRRVYAASTNAYGEGVGEMGHSVNLINEQPLKASEAFAYLINMCTSLTSALTYIAISIVASPTFGLAGIALGALVTIVYRGLNSRLRRLSLRLASETGDLGSLVVQTISSLRYLTATNQKQKFDSVVSHYINNLSGYLRSVSTAKALIQASREPLSILTLVAVVLLNLKYFGSDVAGMVASALLLYRAATAILNVQTDFSSVMAFSGAIEYLKHELLVKDRGLREYGSTHDPRLNPAVELIDVGFVYGGNNGHEVLRSINLKIEPCTSVAILGPSGCGKSTLLSLVARAEAATEGVVLLGGVNELDLDRVSWRSQLGYVTQEAVVFNGTVADNIGLWSTEQTYNDRLAERVIQAAKAAHLHEKIKRLPDGYLTPIGEQGLKLSGGETQRLFIARELFRQPSVLLLDEATSALDVETERAVRSTIDSLRGTMTIIAVSHNIASVRNFDRAIILEKGEIVEDGWISLLMKDKNSRFNGLMEQKND